MKIDLIEIWKILTMPKTVFQLVLLVSVIFQCFHLSSSNELSKSIADEKQPQNIPKKLSSGIIGTSSRVQIKKNRARGRIPSFYAENNESKKFHNVPLRKGSSQTGKFIEPKQSWLAVASAVASSPASSSSAVEKAHQFPIAEDNKPTKYHYYPYNQHLYLLPECATQQVCSAVYLRLNYSQPLCACPTNHRPCSVSTRTDDQHTIPLVTGSQSQVLTLVKTCEPTYEVRECRAPKDWSILALQNSRTGKAHYLVICRCPNPGHLEGPIAHSQPAYARVPGIRVYGMTCVRIPNRAGRGRHYKYNENQSIMTSKEKDLNPPFPWHKLTSLFLTALSEDK